MLAANVRKIPENIVADHHYSEAGSNDSFVGVEQPLRFRHRAKQVRYRSAGSPYAID
jgi:hypothetical protein